MCQKVLRSARLFEALLHLDRELAREAREAGCPCGGRLHSASFPRKVSEWPAIPKALREADPDCTKQFGLCCDREGCRTRTLPPSTRFLGRRRYLAATVVLVSALACGLSAWRLAHLERTYSISRRTLERWRAWWLEAFPRSDAWRVHRARFAPPADEDRLPGAIVERFGALGTRSGLIRALRIFALVGASDHVVRRALAGPQRTHRANRRGIG